MILKYSNFLFESSRNKENKLYVYSGKIFRIIGLKDILDVDSLLKLEELKSEYDFDDWARGIFVCKDPIDGPVKGNDLDTDVKLSLSLNQTMFYTTSKDKDGFLIEDEDFVFTDSNENDVYLYIFNKNKNDGVRGGKTRQIHGFNYEKFIKSSNGLSIKDAYTSRWDAKGRLSDNFINIRLDQGFEIVQMRSGKMKQIESFADIDSSFKMEYLWNIKNIKEGAGIDMGDLLRISGLTRSNGKIEKITTTPVNQFMLCIGFWENDKDNIVDEYIILMDRTQWEQMLPYFVRQFLNDRKSKDLPEMYEELPNFRTKIKQNSQEWKDYIDKYKDLSGNSIIMPRFKRDSKGQLRIQAGISNSDFLLDVISRSNYLHLAR